MMELAQMLASAEAQNREVAERAMEALLESKPGRVVSLVLRSMGTDDDAMSNEQNLLLMIVVKNHLRKSEDGGISAEEWEELIELVFPFAFFPLILRSSGTRRYGTPM